MSKVRRAVVALLVSLAVAFGVFAVATPAHAAWSSCSIGWVCVWDGNAGSGSPLYSAPIQGAGTCHNISSWANDQANSFYNHMGNGRHVQFYADANCTGHGLHKDNNGIATGGIFDPFEDGEVGTILMSGNGNCHCDRNKMTSIFFNNG